MHIREYIAKFKNHPVLFVGTGLSLRYLKNSYAWDGLMKKIALDFNDNDEYYLQIKYDCRQNNRYIYENIAKKLEEDFNRFLEKNRNGKLGYINDIFYENMSKEISVSRFKVYIADILKEVKFKDSMLQEIDEFKKIRKNISSIITTNYDCMIEKIFEFNPLIGNNILLSNPYGSLYKIHGCVTNPAEIIITSDDYEKFDRRYELIRAQLLSLFIHNPIIFIGYNIGDKNIKYILKTIFSYVNYNSEQSKKIRDNFLLIEYDEGSKNTEITEHDIDVDIHGEHIIRINKLKTDNFIEIYDALANLKLPVSAMDIRKVQSVFQEIVEGGQIQVSITENLEDLKNSDKVLAIGSKKTITYTFQTTSEMMVNYFKIMEEENEQLILLINKQRIQSQQFFPVFGFSKICKNIQQVEKLKQQQKDKIDLLIKNAPKVCKGNHNTPYSVLNDNDVRQTYKCTEIICSIMSGMMDLNSVKDYLIEFEDKNTTEYRKILCAYDLKNYA